MVRVCIRQVTILFIATLVFGCSEVVEPVRLPGLLPDHSLQEKFDIKLQPLTFKVASDLNKQSYPRSIFRPGASYAANLISEASIPKSEFPPDSKKTPYKLGVGDEVNLINYLDTAGQFDLQPGVVDLETGLDNIADSQVSVAPTGATAVVSSRGRVGTDGNLLLLDVGRLEAIDKEISELRDEVRGILIRNGKDPNFQLEIVKFNSQHALITSDRSEINGQRLIPITDKGLTLKEAVAFVEFDQRKLTIIKLQRNGKTYSITLQDLFAESAPEVYLKNKDHVFIERYDYAPGKVYLVGGVLPKLLPITPESRQSLAEVLFAEGGPMASLIAQRSAVYLLRGQNPTTAYHLDTQNPTRILVAESVELRPNDIVFVAEQPISIFNRALATILPLRILSRDIQNNNVP